MTLCDHIQFKLGMDRPPYTQEPVSAQQMSTIGEAIRRLSNCHLPLPVYKCPKCHSRIYSRPIPAFALMRVADDVTRLHQKFKQENPDSDVVTEVNAIVAEDTVAAEVTWNTFFVRRGVMRGTRDAVTHGEECR
jgi:hypothetical protein